MSEADSLEKLLGVQLTQKAIDSVIPDMTTVSDPFLHGVPEMLWACMQDVQEERLA